MKKTKILFFILIFLSILLSGYFYHLMPDKMVTHWNSEGVANGTMSKIFGLGLFPVLLILLGLLFYYLPRIDPMRKNVESFENEMDIFFILIFIFFIIIQIFVIMWNLGFEINIGIIVLFCISIIFIYLGILLKKTKRNFFMGIRTPWTLSSDIVWDKTHSLGGKLFMIAGFFSFMGLFFKKFMIYFILVPLAIIILVTMIYSYFMFRKIKK